MIVPKEEFRKEILRLQSERKAERKRKSELEANAFVFDMIEKCRRSKHHGRKLLRFQKGRG